MLFKRKRRLFRVESIRASGFDATCQFVLVDQYGKVDEITLPLGALEDTSLGLLRHFADNTLFDPSEYSYKGSLRDASRWLDWLTVVCPKKHRDEIMGEVDAWLERNRDSHRFFLGSMVVIKAFQVMSIGLRLRIAGLIGLIAGAVRWIL